MKTLQLISEAVIKDKLAFKKKKIAEVQELRGEFKIVNKIVIERTTANVEHIEVSIEKVVVMTGRRQDPLPLDQLTENDFIYVFIHMSNGDVLKTSGTVINDRWNWYNLTFDGDYLFTPYILGFKAVDGKNNKTLLSALKKLYPKLNQNRMLDTIKNKIESKAFLDSLYIPEDI
jgi:hypothetical protein